MSDEGQKPTDEVQNANNQQHLDAEKLAATNARLLKESQDYKEKYRASLKEKEELEAKKAQESGDISAQLELEKKKRQQYQDELNKTKKKVVTQAVREKISKYAGDVHNLDDLLSRPALKNFLKEGLDEENLDFHDESAKAFVEEVKKDSPYLWKNMGSMGVNTSRAGSVGTSESSIKSLDKMGADEMKEYILKTFS
jgi:DNA repair exonuclease SbcCD ATPase subunit